MRLRSISSKWKRRPPQSATDPLKLYRSRATQIRLIRTLTELAERGAFPPFVIASQAMLDHLLNIDVNRDSLAPVLITGETGTGKELFARAVHVLGPREKKEFVTYNCAEATNRELIKSELFGHRRGSFTGATEDSIGVIREADGGTLFLDEIGELPLDVQPKLLRFLQEGEVRPIGAKPIKTNARVIAATNRNLEEEVRAGRFRADLYHRLNVVRLHLPPLRERREEIPLLIVHFLERYQQETRRKGLRLRDEAIKALLDYDWPGNVRQLSNEICRLVSRSLNYEVIGPELLSPEIRTGASASPAPVPATDENSIVIDPSLSYSQGVQEARKQLILRGLKKTNGNVKQAAAIMQISRIGLVKAIKKLGIKVKRDDCS